MKFKKISRQMFAFGWAKLVHLNNHRKLGGTEISKATDFMNNHLCKYEHINLTYFYETNANERTNIKN